MRTQRLGRRVNVRPASRRRPLSFFLLTLILGSLLAVAAPAPQPAFSLEGTGTHRGTAYLIDICTEAEKESGYCHKMAFVPSEFCAHTSVIYGSGKRPTENGFPAGTEFEESKGTATITAGRVTYAGPIHVEFFVPDIWQGPFGSKKGPGCKTDPGAAAVESAIVTGENADGSSIDCRWDASQNPTPTFERSPTVGDLLELPAGTSNPPSPGQPGTCTIKTTEGESSTYNVKMSHKWRDHSLRTKRQKL